MKTFFPLICGTSRCKSEYSEKLKILTSDTMVADIILSLVKSLKTLDARKFLLYYIYFWFYFILFVFGLTCSEFEDNLMLVDLTRV